MVVTIFWLVHSVWKSDRKSYLSSGSLRFHDKCDFPAIFKQCVVDSFFEIACSLIGSIFTVNVLYILFHFRFLLIASTNGTPWRIKAKWTEIWSWKRRDSLNKAENDGSESFVTLEFCIWNVDYSTLGSWSANWWGLKEIVAALVTKYWSHDFYYFVIH